MSEIDNPKALFESTCSTNSEPYALQNIGDMMSPEFSENCIIIVDPAMPIHHQAFVIIDFNDDLYFRQYIKKVLLDAINNGGTTLNDFSNVDGEAGYFAQVLSVYGCNNMPCKRCDGKIKRIVQNQRGTYYCPKCQK